MVHQAAFTQSSAKERETAAKLQESEKALQDALQELNDTKANEQYYMAECQRLHDELQSRPDQPWKLAGLKKCNKCKKFCWDGTGKFCVNMGCSTNVKTVAEASMQTGEDVADVIVDEKRFEELTPVIPTDEHEARMQAWRAATEAVEPPATAEAAPSAPTSEAAPSFFDGEEDDVTIIGEKPAKKRRQNTLMSFVTQNVCESDDAELTTSNDARQI